MQEVKTTCNSCRVCAEIKPRFYRPNQESHVIKATRPMERISIDFKGPVAGPRKYLLVIVDEYSRFPFAYPCNDMTSATVIDRLTKLFCLVGVPEYVHSDRGKSFLSKEVTSFLTRKGIATSRSTPYHPTGNSQCERMNQTLWKSVKLLLATRKRSENYWETVLADALHTIRSLLCTSTNTCPHDRFFNFSRRSMLGQSIPDWLLHGGTVLLRNFVRNKGDPLVVKVKLLEANPKYALIRQADGQESTVSIQDLAPYPVEEMNKDSPDTIAVESSESFVNQPSAEDALGNTGDEIVERAPEDQSNPESTEPSSPEIGPPLRRSTRLKRKPERYGYD